MSKKQGVKKGSQQASDYIRKNILALVMDADGGNREKLMKYEET